MISDFWKVHMTSLQVTIRRYLTPILLLLLAGGFLVVLGELYLYHHWRGTQLIGFSATVIGLVAVLLGLFAKRGFRLGLAVLLVLISVSGLIGTWEHFESRSEEGGEAARPALAATAQAADATNMTIAYQPAAGRAHGHPGRRRRRRVRRPEKPVQVVSAARGVANRLRRRWHR